jgi:hypothetical protein
VNKVPRYALLTAGILAMIAICIAATNRPFRERTVGGDFITFYCAARSINERVDPYRAEPLGSCERNQKRPATVVPSGVAMPAPLPPYALAVFCPLARLPYFFALAIWDSFILAATWLCILAMERLTKLPLPALICCFGVGTLVAIDVGQVAPVSTAALALCAYFARARKSGLAALAAGAAMIEPHVALPACLALFAWMPQARIVLAMVAVAYAGISVVLVGSSVAFEYLHSVLPAHALSEVNNQQQISLTYVVHHFGVPAVPAMQIGQLWYFLMLMLGVWSAGRFLKRAPELVPTLPVAFTLFGGAFIHIVQMPAALPAALILIANAPSAAVRRTTSIATIVLALPIMHYPILYPLSLTLYPAITVILVSTFMGARLLQVIAWAFVAEIVPFGLWAQVHFPALHPSLMTLSRDYDPRALADVSWARYMGLIATTNPPQLDFFKLQIWLALATILWMAVSRALASGASNARLALVNRLSSRAATGSSKISKYN